MIRTLLVLFVLLTSLKQVQSKENPVLKPGLYKGVLSFKEYPSVESGYYWLKADSTFVQVAIAADSTVLHINKGKWTLDKNGALSVNYVVCPILSLPYNKLNYDASNAWASDSTRINVTVLKDNGDTTQLYFVYVDDVRYVVCPGAKGNPVGNNTKGTIVLPGKEMYKRVKISASDRVLPYFDETVVELSPGYNVHNIVLRTSHTAEPFGYFRPTKEEEAKRRSFTKPFTKMLQSNMYDFSNFSLTYAGSEDSFLRSVLNRSIKDNNGYKEYFLWALASL